MTIADNDSSDGHPELSVSLAPWGTCHHRAECWICRWHQRRAPPHSGDAQRPGPQPRHGPGAECRSPDSCTPRLRPPVGAAAPRIVGVDDRLHHSLRHEPTLLRALGEAVLGGRRAARYAPLGETISDAARYRDGVSADWATGAALLIARRAMDVAGEWDERFFLYSEETDYCLRLRDAGFRLHLVADAVVVHRGGDQSTSPKLGALAA